MSTTTPFPSEMRPARSREDAPQPKSPFETLDMCDTINRIITDLTDRLDPVLVTENSTASGQDSIVVERPKAKLLEELQRIAFRLRCLDQRITL